MKECTTPDQIRKVLMRARCEQIGIESLPPEYEKLMSKPLHPDIYGKENYQHMKSLLKFRVSSSRYRHSKGVAQTAKYLARIYDQDEKKARMAGILHDWDKGLNNEQARARVRELGLSMPQEVLDDMPFLLHGPTAAAALKRDFPVLGDDVCQAIARHTSGAADMTPLDSIIYVADIIEPNRVYGDADGIAELRDQVGNISLDELYFNAFKYTLSFLIERERRLFPGTIDIWNALMGKCGQRVALLPT